MRLFKVSLTVEILVAATNSDDAFYVTEDAIEKIEEAVSCIANIEASDPKTVDPIAVDPEIEPHLNGRGCVVQHPKDPTVRGLLNDGLLDGALP